MLYKKVSEPKEVYIDEITNLEKLNIDNKSKFRTRKGGKNLFSFSNSFATDIEFAENEEKLIDLTKKFRLFLNINEYVKLIEICKKYIPFILKPSIRDKLEKEINKFTNNKISEEDLFSLIKILSELRLDSSKTKDDLISLLTLIGRKYNLIEPIDSTNVIGFKNKNKENRLKELRPQMEIYRDFHTTSFPLKMNTKLYQLHRTAPRFSYIIDLMIEDRGFIKSSKEKATFVYLLAMNINTRFLFVELLNKVINLQTNSYSKVDVKSSSSFLRGLNKMYEKGIRINHLVGDSEKCFWSYESQKFYDEIGVFDYWPVERQKKAQYPLFMKTKQSLNNKSEPSHNALGIVDRAIRTLRDMAFHMEIDVITPNIMESLVFQYNNAPHSTLTKYAGFPVTPFEAQCDIELEDLIVKNIARENYLIRERVGFYIPTGTRVKIYNEKDNMKKRRSVIQPGAFEIVAFSDGLYIVKNIISEELQSVPRWKLSPIS